MFDWMGRNFGLRENLLHFFFCNNRVFQGCTGHMEKMEVLRAWNGSLDQVERLMNNRERGGGDVTRMYEQPGFTTVYYILEQLRRGPR